MTPPIPVPVMLLLTHNQFVRLLVFAFHQGFVDLVPGAVHPLLASPSSGCMLDLEGITSLPAFFLLA